MNRHINILSPAVGVSMADEWYDFASADHFWMQWRFNVLFPHLQKFLTGETPTEKFLEIGCGHGQFIEQMDKRTKLVTDGCDLNLLALEKVGNIRGSIYVYDINTHHPSMTEKYSGIFLLDVIEHIEKDQAFLVNAISHTKPGGLIFINVPALNGLFSRYDIAAGHKRRYTKSQLKALFLESGIEPVSIRYWGLSLVLIALIRKFYLKFVPGEKIIEKGFNPPSQFVNKCLISLMRLETALVSDPFVGTSVMAIGRKRP